MNEVDTHSSYRECWSTGFDNTATGSGALFSNTTGFNNVADGFAAAINITMGSNNTVLGMPKLEFFIDTALSPNEPGYSSKRVVDPESERQIALANFSEAAEIFPLETK